MHPPGPDLPQRREVPIGRELVRRTRRTLWYLARTPHQETHRHPSSAGLPVLVCAVLARRFSGTQHLERDQQFSCDHYDCGFRRLALDERFVSFIQTLLCPLTDLHHSGTAMLLPFSKPYADARTVRILPSYTDQRLACMTVPRHCDTPVAD